MTDSPGPGGSWPLDPQVPAYEHPQYPVEPPVYYAPPTAYSGQPYPGQPSIGQPPYGPPQAQSYGPPPEDPGPDRVPVQYGVLAIVAVALIAVIGIGIAVWSMSWAPRTPPAAIWAPDPTGSARVATVPPSVEPSSSTFVNCSGALAGTSGWQATIPPGWSCRYEAGAEIYLVDAQADSIFVQATNSSVAAACSTDLARDATVTPLPDSTWGGRTAKTAAITFGGEKGQVRCVYGAGFTFVMLGLARGGTLDQVVAGESALAGTWFWKF